MKKHIVKYCRELIYLIFSVYSDYFPPFLGILTLLSFLPAFLYGCNAPQALPDTFQETVTKICMNAVSGQVKEMDIFVFHNDRMQKLDCYQKVAEPLFWNNEIVSGTGERLIAVCANSRKEVMDWTAINSLSYLKNLSVSLESESIGHPFMSGIAEVSAGKNDKHKTLDLQPLLSTVELRSISCDFEGRPYAGEVLEDVKVYLTASVETRAKRRYLELQEKGVACDLAEIARDIEERDTRDMNREIAPLKQAEDAVYVDSSDMTIDEVTEAIKTLCKH